MGEFVSEIEINEIDTRFESCRLKNKYQEDILLSSILQRGIKDPLLGVKNPNGSLILLDGFKRLRCLKKLNLHKAPVKSLGEDEVSGILQLIRLANASSLNILEQAAYVDELSASYNMRAADIADHLEKSRAWVSVRLGMLSEMSPLVRESVFSGKFPVRSYMYTLRQFTRVNKISKSEIDIFVTAVSGKKLTTRDIDTLAYGYFRGGASIKKQVREGNLEWTLKQMKKQESFPVEASSLSEREAKALRDMELVQKYMGRVCHEIQDARHKSPSFFSTALMLVEGIFDRFDFFQKTLKDFYDQRRQTKSGAGPS